MSENLIDHQAVRARVEQQLAPRFRLLRKRMWLLAHIGLFIMAGIILHSPYGNPIFFQSIVHDIPGGSYPPFPGTTDPIVIPPSQYTEYVPHFLTSVVAVIRAFLLILHILMYWTAWRRERIIETAMSRELELEKMRLQIELARLNGETPEGEKRKRSLSLSDDGELNDGEEVVLQPVKRRTANG